MRKMTFRLPEDLRTKMKLALIRHNIGMQHLLEASIEKFIELDADTLSERDKAYANRVLERAKALAVNEP